MGKEIADQITAGEGVQSDPPVLDDHMARLAQYLRTVLDDPALIRHHRLDLIRAYGTPLTQEQNLEARQILAWHLLLKSVWIKVAANLEAAQIPVVLLKGLYWSAQIYPQPSLRMTGDLDILVPRAQVETARACLLGMGCEWVGSPWMTDSTQLARHFHWNFSYPTGSRSVSIELHWQLARSGENALTPSQIWQHTVHSPGGWRLTRELDLLFACMHAHRHGLEMFRYLIDVARIQVTWGDEIDWEIFWQLSRQARVDRIAAFVLLLAWRHALAPLPTAQVQRIQHRSMVRLAAWPFGSERLLGSSSRPKLRRLWISVATASGPSMVDALREIFVPPSELVAAEYEVAQTSPFALATAYLLRPMRLVLKYLKR